MNDNNIFEVKNLSKVYPAVTAVDDASLTVKKGEVDVYFDYYNINNDTTIQAQYEYGYNKFTGKSFAILGDSISTFYAEGSEMNSYYTGENEFYYPRYSASIKTVDLTWWYKLIKNNGMVLGINNHIMMLFELLQKDH